MPPIEGERRTPEEAMAAIEARLLLIKGQVPIKEAVNAVALSVWDLLALANYYNRRIESLAEQISELRQLPTNSHELVCYGS